LSTGPHANACLVLLLNRTLVVTVRNGREKSGVISPPLLKKEAKFNLSQPGLKWPIQSFDGRLCVVKARIPGGSARNHHGRCNDNDSPQVGSWGVTRHWTSPPLWSSNIQESPGTLSWHPSERSVCVATSNRWLERPISTPWLNMLARRRNCAHAPAIALPNLTASAIRPLRRGRSPALAGIIAKLRQDAGSSRQDRWRPARETAITGQTRQS
jgi:hypothetical protein